jgi:hypothetical protein
MGMGPGSARLAASEAGTLPAPLGGTPGGARKEAWGGTSAAPRAANEPLPVRDGAGPPGGTGLPSPARPVVRWRAARLPRVEARAVRMPGPRPSGCRWASPLGRLPRACGLRAGRRAAGEATAARDRRCLLGAPPLRAGRGRNQRSATASATGRGGRSPRQRRYARKLDPAPAGPVAGRIRRPQRLRRHLRRPNPRWRHRRRQRLRPAASWSRSIPGLDPVPGPRAVVRTAGSAARRPPARRHPRPRRFAHRYPRPRWSAPQGPVPRSSEPDAGAGSCGALWAQSRPVRPGGLAQGRLHRWPRPGHLPGPARRPRRNPRPGALPVRGPDHRNEARPGRRHQRGHRCPRRRWAARAGWRSPGRSAGPATSRSRHPPTAREPAREPGASPGHREPGRAAERPSPAARRPPDGRARPSPRPAEPRSPPRPPSPPSATPRPPGAPPPPTRRPWTALRGRS